MKNVKATNTVTEMSVTLLLHVIQIPSHAPGDLDKTWNFRNAYRSSKCGKRVSFSLVFFADMLSIKRTSTLLVRVYHVELRRKGKIILSEK